MLAGPVKRATVSEPPGVDSDPEVTFLYIKWYQQKQCFNESLPHYTMLKIISQAEWLSQCSQIKLIGLADLYPNELTIVLMG